MKHKICRQDDIHGILFQIISQLKMKPGRYVMANNVLLCIGLWDNGFRWRAFLKPQIVGVLFEKFCQAGIHTCIEKSGYTADKGKVCFSNLLRRNIYAYEWYGFQRYDQHALCWFNTILAGDKKRPWTSAKYTVHFARWHPQIHQAPYEVAPQLSVAGLLWC